MKRVILVGSPRTGGRSDHLAEMLFEANIDERPEDELFLVPVSEIEVGSCIGCNACRKKFEVTVRDDDGNEVTNLRHRCVFDDDMQVIYDLLDEADVLTVVCPVYFSGTPAPMKCLLDRLQPYFWKYREDGPILPKRPLDLHIVGEGGDPHGYGPLVSEVKAPLALAGFGLEHIFDWIGKISADGTVEAEAVEVEVPLPLPSGSPKNADAYDDGAYPEDGWAAEEGVQSSIDRDGSPSQGASTAASSRPRPKLNLTEAAGGRGAERASAKQRRESAGTNTAGKKPASSDKGARGKGGAKGRGPGKGSTGKGAAKGGSSAEGRGAAGKNAGKKPAGGRNGANKAPGKGAANRRGDRRG